MAARIRATIDPIARDIGVILPEVEPAERSRLFAAFAQGEIDEADQQNRRALGTIPPRTVTVDGREGAPLERVKPNGGRIVAEWQLFGEVFEWIEDMLILNSPVGKESDKRPGHPGFYQRSHEFTADGRAADPANAPLDAEEWVFQSLAPYSRKLERRYDLYASVTVMAQKRFGNVLAINFGFRPTILTEGKRVATDSRMPAIIINHRG